MTKKVMILGSSSLLGRELTNIFLRSSFNVVGTSRSSKSEFNVFSSYKHYVYEANTSMLEGILDIEFKDTDVLINCISDTIVSPVEDIRLGHIRYMNDINIGVPIEAIQRYMVWKKHDEGINLVINVGSMAHKYALRYQLLYCVYKAGLVMMTKQLARECATTYPNFIFYCVSPCAFGNGEKDNVGGMIDKILPKMVSKRGFKNKKEALKYYVQSPTGKLADVKDVARFIYHLSFHPSKHFSGTNFEMQDCMP